MTLTAYCKQGSKHPTILLITYQIVFEEDMLDIVVIKSATAKAIDHQQSNKEE